MTTGQKAVSLIGNAVPSFMQTFMAAQGLANQQAAQQTRAELGRGRLDIQRGQLTNDMLNTGLRGGELNEKVAARGSLEDRTAARNKIDLFKSMSGGYAPHNPEGYTQALHADPAQFGELMSAAQGLAMRNQQTQAGRLAGTRAAAGAGAKSRQKEIDNARIAETQEHIKAGTLEQAKAAGFEPYMPPPRQAGQSMDDALDKANIQLGGQDIAHARRLAAAGRIVPQALATRAAVAAIKRNRQLDAEYEGADPKRRAQIEAEVIDSLFGIDNVE